MKRLLILGAGGMGREILQWAFDINQVNRQWDDVVFLDPNPNALKGKKAKTTVLGNEADYDIGADDEFICAVGNAKMREIITEKIEKKGGHFINLIHPTANVAQSVDFGGGVVIYPNTIVTADTFIGKGTVINMNCCIGHDVQIGNYCVIGPNCDITGMCILGDRVFLGVDSHIIPSVEVGNDSFVCAGSVVMSKVREGTRVMGYPAKRVLTWESER